MNSARDANKFMFFFMLYSCLSSVILTLIAVFMRGVGLSSDRVMNIMLVMQDIVVFMVPMTFYIIIKKKSLCELVPLKPLSLKNIVYVVVITLLMMPVMSVFSTITQMFVSAEVSDQFRDIMLDVPWWLSIFFMAIMPPFCEEFMFRGYIMTGYKRVGFLRTALVSALFFGLMHLDLYQLPYAVFAGIIMAGFVSYTGSIFSSMLAHFIVNGSQTIVFLLATKLMDKTQLEQQLAQELSVDERIATLYAQLMLMIICLPFLIHFVRKFAKHNEASFAKYYGEKSPLSEYGIITRPTEKKFIDKYFVGVIVVYILYMVLEKL